MATRNSSRNDDRSSSRNASSAGASSGRSNTSSAPSSGGTRQNSGVNSGVGGVGAAGSSASTPGAGPETRAGAAQNSGAGASSSRADQERQLRTSREESAARTSPRGNVGRPQQQQQHQEQQQQGRPLATSGFYGGGSPFAMMRRMMDDMDRLFSDFGLVQPGWMSSSFFGPDLWSPVDTSRAIGSGQSRNTGQQRALGDQQSGQQGLQRTGQGAGGLQGWQQGLWSPQVEIRERDNNIVVRADLPGLSRDDVDVEVEDDALIIRGERHNDWEDQNEQEGYYRSERSYGSFYRAIPLPEGVDPNACNASFKDGVLEVTLPKPKEAQSKGRKIQVK